MKLSKKALNKGLNFGLTSAVITTLGLLIGLYATTGSKMVILGGVITIAIADSFSDALGIHISEEADERNTHLQAWQSTIFAFLGKFIFALTFIIPILIFEMQTAIIVNIIWGFLILSLLSIMLALKQKKKILATVFEHLLIAIIVIISSYYVGILVSKYLG